MLIKAIFFVALAALAVAAPEHIEKRQDLNQLLQLASIAGITLPTDPAVLLQLGPIAQRLASALPTPSVLSVLETAAPKSFISNVVHDQSFANSFQSAFAAGSSPSWFNALPTGVKSYMHTYSGFAGLNSAAGILGEGSGTVSQLLSESATSAKSNSATKTAAPSSTASSTTAGSTSSTSTDNTSSSTSSTPASAAGGSSTSSTSATPNEAARPTGAMAAGLVGVVGILGLAVGL